MFGRWPKVTWLKKVIWPETIVKKPSAKLAFGLIMHPNKRCLIFCSRLKLNARKEKFFENFFAKGLSSLQPNMQPIRIVDP